MEMTEANAGGLRGSHSDQIGSHESVERLGVEVFRRVLLGQVNKHIDA